MQNLRANVFSTRTHYCQKIIMLNSHVWSLMSFFFTLSRYIASRDIGIAEDFHMRIASKFKRRVQTKTRQLYLNAFLFLSIVAVAVAVLNSKGSFRKSGGQVVWACYLYHSIALQLELYFKSPNRQSAASHQYYMYNQCKKISFVSQNLTVPNSLGSQSPRIKRIYYKYKLTTFKSNYLSQSSPVQGPVHSCIPT